MTTSQAELDLILRSIESINQLVGELPPKITVERKALRGGLEASKVTLVTARFRDAAGRPHMHRFVVKQLDGLAIREAAVYQNLAVKFAGDISPRLLAVAYSAPDRALICVEAIRRSRAWPWQDVSAIGDLLARLARFHISARPGAAAIPQWDYEEELSNSAEATWSTVDRCRLHSELAALARDLPPLTRVVLARPRLRRELLTELPFGSGPIHGDVHSGNVLMRRRGCCELPVLLDWGRARLGSPLEDASSWLQSLGYWEQNAKRYHDTLLTAYLSTFGVRKLTSDTRAAYWIASASNALAGTLLHHICVAEDERQSASRRAAAFGAARDWLRVIRRADAWSS